MPLEHSDLWGRIVGVNLLFHVEDTPIENYVRGRETEKKQFSATFIIVIYLRARRLAFLSHLDWEDISSSTIMTWQGSLMQERRSL